MDVMHKDFLAVRGRDGWLIRAVAVVVAALNQAAAYSSQSSKAELPQRGRALAASQLHRLGVDVSVIAFSRRAGVLKVIRNSHRVCLAYR